MIATVASHQLVALRRQRVLAALIGSFVILSALAGVLGWSSNHTIGRVFDQAAKLLASTGQPPPPNPFLLKPALSPLSNMVVYVPLLGALFAIVLGHLSLSEDKASGIGRLLFSRHVTRTQYAVGKATSAATALALALCAGLVVSAASLLIVNRGVTISDIARLSAFYALSWLYLISFVLIGMIAVLLTRRQSLALLTAIGAWLVVTFFVPQFTSGLRPTQSLHPLIEPVGTSQRFFQITAHGQPFSVIEQYKATAAVILNTAPAESTAQIAVRLLPVTTLAAILVLITLRLVQRHDFSRGASDE